MTTQSSVPAQAMEVLTVPDHIARDVEQCESADRWNDGVPFKSRWERKLYESGFAAGWDRARALVAASLCAAQPTRYYCNKCGSFPATQEHNRPDGQPCKYLASAGAAAQGGQQPTEGWDGRCVLGHCCSPSGCERDERCRADYTAPAAPAAPLTARMPSDDELRYCTLGLGSLAGHRAAIRRFCEVNGITLAGTAGTKKESEHG